MGLTSINSKYMAKVRRAEQEGWNIVDYWHDSFVLERGKEIIILDMFGEAYLGMIFSTFEKLSKGTTLLKNDSGNCALLGECLEKYIGFEDCYTSIVYQSDGNYVVSRKVGNKRLFGLTNDKGKLIIPLDFYEVSYFSDGLYQTYFSLEKFSIFDLVLEREKYSEVIFNQVQKISENVAEVLYEKEGKTTVGYILICIHDKRIFERCEQMESGKLLLMSKDKMYIVTNE